MTQALRYLILGFTLAAVLQLFANPPTWALYLAVSVGIFIGVALTVVQMYFTDLLEKHNL